MFYITTPIYYVNSDPHIGHAYTNIVTDIIARYKRKGEEVRMVTGTDEHGLKIQRSAEKEGIEVKKYVDKVSEKFRRLTEKLELSNDDFIRTTEERHVEVVKECWNKLMKKGYIYKGNYEGWYSISDECFYKENELVNDKAPTGSKVEWIKEETYYFKLSIFKEELIELFSNKNIIEPYYRQKEIINMLKEDLPDLSISRTSFNWGVKVPNDEKHVIYVWLDALLNYISVNKYPKEIYQVSLHVIGKDILKFHAIYWYAFLIALELPLPEKILAHGWWICQGNKMSKSIGNIVDPFVEIEKYGLDAFRWYLARGISCGEDGNYDSNILISRYNSDLINCYGNLIQRTLSLTHKFNISVHQSHQPLIESFSFLVSELDANMSTYSLHTYCECLLKYTSILNKFVNELKPWVDTCSKLPQLSTILSLILVLNSYYSPIIPSSSLLINSYISIYEDFYITRKPSIIFPKL